MPRNSGLQGIPHVRAASAIDAGIYPGTIPVFARLDQTDLMAVVELVEAGKVSVCVARTYPLERAAGVQAFLSQGYSHGKVILEVG